MPGRTESPVESFIKGALAAHAAYYKLLIQIKVQLKPDIPCAFPIGGEERW